MDIKIITWKETDMRFLATGEEMQKIDQISIEQIGIPGLVLMERAALAVTEEIEKTIQVTVKCNEGDRGAIKCTAKYNPDPSRQYGGFIDYDSGKENIARIGTPVYYKWVDRTITEKVEVEKTIPYTYSIKLGANAPGTSDDYSLYRNNNYTFNINLK